MGKFNSTLLLSIFLIGISFDQSFAQGSYILYTVPQNGSTNVLIENGKLYRVTIKSCWYSAYARMGSYLIYGLNIADPLTNGEPEVLTISESSSIDWTFGFSQNGDYDADISITSNGWGDQGLLIVVEKFSYVNTISGSDISFESYSLSQNYPNPFNPSTTIIYGLPKLSHVDIRIYDLLGREVTTLVNNNQEAKHYKVIWDAKDRLGNSVPSGMYLYRIVAKSGNKTFVKTRKLLLMR